MCSINWWQSEHKSSLIAKWVLSDFGMRSSKIEDTYVLKRQNAKRCSRKAERAKTAASRLGALSHPKKIRCAHHRPPAPPHHRPLPHLLLPSETTFGKSLDIHILRSVTRTNLTLTPESNTPTRLPIPHPSITMPVKRAAYGAPKEQGYVSSAWSTVTSSDNRTMVTALGMFAVRTHLHRNRLAFLQDTQTTRSTRRRPRTLTGAPTGRCCFLPQQLERDDAAFVRRKR